MAFDVTTARCVYDATESQEGRNWGGGGAQTVYTGRCLLMLGGETPAIEWPLRSTLVYETDHRDIIQSVSSVTSTLQ